MQRFLYPATLLMFALATGCYTEASVTSGGYAYVEAPAPDLVYVSPGVQVIADYDYPVFYSGGAYWRYDGGVWYSSRVYNGGWAVSYNVPVAVRGVSNPGGYVHYRANVNANAGFRGNGGVDVRDHRGYQPAAASGPVVRDHRGPSAQPAYRPAPARPVVRDHRH